ncbi:MAG: pseudouridine synthase [Candidatus Absconditabacteria bacterium]
MNKTLLSYLQSTKAVSRRDFFDMLNNKVIKINGEIIEDSKAMVTIGDKITIDLGKGQIYEETIELKKERFKSVIVAFNKPKGYVVSKDDKFNKTIFEILPKSWKDDFYYIGRLDKESNGLLLLTNNTKIVDEMEHPKSRIFKIYEVVVDKMLRTKDMIKMKRGLFVDEHGEKTDDETGMGVDKLEFYDIKQFKDEKGKYFLRIMLTEGRKRHIRRLLSACGYKTKSLKRIKYGKYELADIKEGTYRIFKV